MLWHGKIISPQPCQVPRTPKRRAMLGAKANHVPLVPIAKQMSFWSSGSDLRSLRTPVVAALELNLWVPDTPVEAKRSSLWATKSFEATFKLVQYPTISSFFGRYQWSLLGVCPIAGRWPCHHLPRASNSCLHLHFLVYAFYTSNRATKPSVHQGSKNTPSRPQSRLKWSVDKLWQHFSWFTITSLEVYLASLRTGALKKEEKTLATNAVASKADICCVLLG